MKISIITPVFNQVDFIESTIVSVLNQNYHDLEYIIIDGGSTDGTIEVIEKYEYAFSYFTSEPDNGMYEALNKGFDKATGDIMTWINSDDILLPGSLENMRKIMTDLPYVDWVQGLNTFIDIDGKITDKCLPKKFSLIKFLNQDYQYIQQESTFWRRSLWLNAGATLNDELKLAGDFELWFRFCQLTQLYTTSIAIGAWRKRNGQLSDIFSHEYHDEVKKVISQYIPSYREKLILTTTKALRIIYQFLTDKELPSNFVLRRIKDLEKTNKNYLSYSTLSDKFESS